jgi:hypothetical protein
VRAFLFRILILSGLLFLYASQVQTAYSAVVINEVYPNPLTGEDEWAELLNTGGVAVDLSGWQLRDQLATSSLIRQFGENTWLEPGAFLLVTFKSILNNDGDAVVLKNAVGDEVSALAFSRSTKGLSWNRGETGETFFEANPTPNEPNEVPTPIPSPTPTPTPPILSSLSPVLSEVMACPADLVEWIELFNPHDESVSLAGFSLRDAKNKIFLFEEETVAAHSFITIDVRSVLNNDADEVWLINPVNQAEDHFSYTNCSGALSFAAKDNEWQETSIITKGSPNIFSFSQENELAESENPESDTSASNTSSPSSLPVVSALLPASASPGSFLYPPSVLNPKLSYEKSGFPTAENIYFADPPRLEKGALSVIMGSSFLLIPGFIYVKNKRTFF